MVEFKLVISDSKTGKTVQKVVSEQDSKGLYELKIGDTFKGELVGFTGYEFKITGGSDTGGFAMRQDVTGLRRVLIHAVEGVGLKKKAKGVRQRKRVAPNNVSELTAQINCVIVKAGKTSLFEEAKPEEATPAKEKKEEKKEAPAEKKTENKKE